MSVASQFHAFADELPGGWISADFSLKVYDVPAQDAADRAFGMLQVMSPDTVQFRISTTAAVARTGR